MSRDAAASLRVLRVGGAGLLVLLTLAAPPILARQQSGAALFGPARGREVLVWGAWRTAWMAGYFYNDGRVREVSGLPAILSEVQKGPRLVLAGRDERRQMESAGLVKSPVLAKDLRGDALLEVGNP
jgi:hypothetical protein